MKTRPLPYNIAVGFVMKLCEDGLYEEALMIFLGITTGFRISDILKLKKQDIEGDYLYVDSEVKTGKVRLVPLNAFKRMKGLFDPFLKHRALSKFLFTGKRGSTGEKPLTVDGANIRLAKVFKEYDIDVHKSTSHTLRKTYARHLYEKCLEKLRDTNMALWIVSRQLNHKSIYDTLTYIGLEDETLDIAYDNF